MNTELISLLKANVGSTLTSDLAADICVAASRMETLAQLRDIAQIKPRYNAHLVFAVERIENITEEIKHLHRSLR